MNGIKSIGVVVVAGLASSAMAQSQSLSVHLSFDVTGLAPGDTTTATLSASFTGQPDGAYLSSVNIDLIASSAIVSAGNVGAVAWNNAGLGFDGQGVANGADVLGINASQFSLIPPVTAGSPIVIMTFTVTAITDGALTYSSSTADGAPFSYSVTGGAFSDQPVSYDDGVMTSDTLFIIPAPSAMALLGLGGLVAGRRRR